MGALSFSLALLGCWFIVGFAIASALNVGGRTLQRALLSPALGLVALILPLFWMSRAGLPVADFAPGWAAFLGIGAVAVLIWRRPPMPWRSLRMPAVILLGALLLTGWPLWRYGFDWLSFANDDMANYALAAQRFLQNGYEDLPDLATYMAGTNYSLAYWYMHVAGGARSGPELLLASLWSISGLNAHQLFMPTILALHLALIASTGAAVANWGGHSRRSGLVLMVMGGMAISPLSTLGALYQLIAQVGGLAMMMAALTLLTQPAGHRWWREAGLQVAVGLLVAGLLIWYPEVLPFLLLAWLCWLTMMVWRGQATSRRGLTRERLVTSAVALLAIAIVFNQYLFTVLRFMLGQAVQGLGKLSPDITFPFYLVPSGIGYFWGLMPIGFLVPEPWLSSAIAIGIAMFVWVVMSIGQASRAAEPVGLLALIMILLGAVLFYRHNDFGLYKLAMFMQPVVIIVIARSIASKPRWLAVTACMLIAAAQLPNQWAYVIRSTGTTAGTLTEIPKASQQALARQFDEFIRSVPQGHPRGYYSDSANVVLAKIQSLYSQGTSIIFPSKEFYWPGGRIGELARSNGWGEFWEKSQQAYAQHMVERTIELSGGLSNTFRVPQAESSLTGRALIANAPEFGIFNRFETPTTQALFRVEERPRNHLIFVESRLGAHYYLARQRRRSISFFQLEDDPMFPGRQMAGVGRHLLFLAAGVDKPPRMLIELSSTVLAHNQARLPEPVVHGREAQPVGFVGRGSGRVLTQPLEPIMVDGLAYLHLDMGREGVQFPIPRSGFLPTLFGRTVALDSRYLTTFARDVSLLSEEQVASMVAPAALTQFPADLGRSGLLYSGLYEDGWVSEHAFAMLMTEPGMNTLLVRGMVPLIDQPDFHSTLTVRIDDQIAAERRLALGDFEIAIPVEPTSRPRRIELKFDRWQTLPAGDGRPTGGLIKHLGFTRD